MMMLQTETGDDVVVPGAGGDCHQNYYSVCYQNIGNYPENDINLGNIVCSMR